ncbi:hypothetical protein G9A89_016533 [Geosiphon pyriformis]|nr:hypothetical protein G9A89_016533 [Geosiphon pyriformis]
MGKLLLVVGGLPDGKAAGLSGIPNELWKHGGERVTECFLVLLNKCLFVSAVLVLWRRAWVSMIPKSYDWDGVLMNTCLIVLIETARKILSKILSDTISFACSKFAVLCSNNFSMLKSTSTQTPVFAVGHEHLCGYSIDTKFVAKSGRVKSGSEMSSFFAASVFVDNTIWVEDCQALMQYVLNIASEFFMINDISINNEKTVAISINQGVKIASLNINGQPISIAKKGETHRYLEIFLLTKSLSKPSLAKAYLDVCFFVNVVLRKTITDKQFSYLVSAILQSIVNYCTQFSFVSSNVCRKWDALVRKSLKLKASLPHDFFDAALHHLSLYGLKSFKQIQTKSKLAAVIVFSNASSILGRLFDYRFLDLQVLDWASLNPLQFPVRLFLHDDGALSSGLTRADQLSGLNILASKEFSDLHSSLHKLWSGFFVIYTDGSLKDYGSSGVAGGAAAYFPTIDCRISVRVCYSGIGGNIKADAAAGVVICSQFSLSVEVREWLLIAEGSVMSDNVCHFVRNMFRSVCRIHWETGPDHNVIQSSLIKYVNWSAISRVWHPDSHMLAGSISWKSSVLQFYLMKAVHHHLPVVVRKRLYDKNYSGILCLLCREVKLPNHVFSCAINADVYNEILAETTVFWVSLMSSYVSPSSAVLWFFGCCSSDISLYSAMCKRFVMSDWCLETVEVLKNRKMAVGIVVNFVRSVAEMYHCRV